MIIGERDQAKVRKQLEAMDKPVKLIYFTQELECEYCRETGQLLRELSGLSDKLTFEEYNFQTDREQKERFGVDKIPATVVMGEKDYGIRFYGVPLGYEFASLLEAVMDASKGESGLAGETKARLAAVTTPLHLQVFVTPT